MRNTIHFMNNYSQLKIKINKKKRVDRRNEKAALECNDDEFRDGAIAIMQHTYFLKRVIHRKNNTKHLDTVKLGDLRRLLFKHVKPYN